MAGRAGVVALIHGVWVRPSLWRWGASDEEVTGPFPVPELVPEGKRSPTMAATIDAASEQVWPWLVQMGGDRGGWYSWDRLDNAGQRSATEIHPEWQDLDVGWTQKSPGRRPIWRRCGASGSATCLTTTPVS